MGVAESLKEDKPLACSLGGNSFLQELHHVGDLEVNRAELSLVELISHLERSVDGFAFFACDELFTPGSLVHNVLTDNLVSRDEDHVVFDSQVGARGVNGKLLLMVNKDDLW